MTLSSGTRPINDISERKSLHAIPAIRYTPGRESVPSTMKKIVIIAVCVVIALVLASGQYIHRGYMGVIKQGDGLVLLDHGLHPKAPWHRATVYPVESRETHLETYYDGPAGKLYFDGVLLLSVCSDSIIKLHRSYEGAYVERLISRPWQSSSVTMPTLTDCVRAGTVNMKWARPSPGILILHLPNMVSVSSQYGYGLLRLEVINESRSFRRG